MSVTLKFQSTGTIPGNADLARMQGGSMTIGRGQGNDVVLPDPDRLISSSHCVIEDHNGNVVIIDLSTNGTFLNYSKIALGKISTPLNDGDVLTMGGYEMVVSITSADQPVSKEIAPPMEQAAISPGSAENAPDPLALLDDAGPGGDFLDDLLGSPDAPVGPSQLKHEDPINELLPPLGEDEDPFFTKPTDGMEATGASEAAHSPAGQDSFSPAASSGNVIPDDWEDDLMGSATEATAPPAPKNAPPVAAPAAALLTATEPANYAAARAFLKTVGAEHLNVADADLQSTMVRMGTVLKTMITGLREILMTRTSIKSEFRIDQTMINAGGNNPLKFSISPEQAIEAMIKPSTKGYLEAGEATEQALDDIKAHEIAMVTGMEAALKGVLQKLNPAELVEKIETNRGFGNILKGKKALYWEVYEKMYGEIADQAENDFHELFSREFAKAYKGQLDKLKG